jgi:O-antigen ligase
MFCNYLNVALVLTIVAAIKGWFSKRFALLLGCAIFLSSIFTISVGLGGIFLALGVLYFFISGSKSSALSFAGLAFSVVFAVIFLLLSVVSLEPTESSSVQIGGFTFAPSGRMLVWADAFQTFKKGPLTGHGLGLPVANVLFRNAEGTSSLLTDAHNSFLSVAAQDGILGFATLLIICAYILYRWRVGIKKTNRYATIGLGVAFLCSFVYQGLTGSFEEARHLWVLMGIFLAADKIESRQDQNS